MDIEALIVIGLFALITGVVLAIPGLWLARRKSKKLPKDAPGRSNVTAFGFIFFVVFIGLLLFVVSLNHFAPEIPTSKRIALLFLVIVAGGVAEKIAAKFGYTITSNNNDRNA